MASPVSHLAPHAAFFPLEHHLQIYTTVECQILGSSDPLRPSWEHRLLHIYDIAAGTSNSLYLQILYARH